MNQNLQAAIDAQTPIVQRLKAYFPYRICWAAVHPETLETQTGADTSKRKINKLLRAGYVVVSA